MSPGLDIDKVALLRFRGLEEAEAAELLTAGELDMADVDGYLQFDTSGSQTSCKLSDLSVFGTEVDITEEYVASADHVYMLLWGTGTTPGTGARTMTFLRPTVGEINTDVVAEPGCNPETGEGILDFVAHLKPAIDVPEDATSVDWRAVTVDGLGNPIIPTNIDRVLLGYYEGMMPDELEANMFDLEIMATDLWEIEHGGGKVADLRTARHREENGDPGDPFTGFGGFPPGTWVIGLMCSICQNPSPVVLAVLNPIGG
jgi:hypothetical protein